MNRNKRILVIDDKQSFRFMVKGYLEDAGYRATCVAGGSQALAELADSDYELVLCDLVMPDMDGVEILHQVRLLHPRLPFVLVTAHGSIDSAVAAMKKGADDYLLKPLKRDELLLVLERLLENAHLQASYDRLLASDREKFSFRKMTSTSAAMKEALTAAQQVAASPRTTVAIYGESGVGKELMAQAIHIASGNSMSNFVKVNCAAIPETMLESELFGQVRGAFTDAAQEREGKCSRAQGGTLLLDDIGDMPLSLQPKLLRLLEERLYEKVGSDRLVHADFRIILATHRNLEECCNQGTFRQDLYHRLNIFPIVIPPLRERREDIPQLAEHFLEKFRQHQGKALTGIAPETIERMMAYSWPGNIRELRNQLEYATIVAGGNLIMPKHLRLKKPGSQPADGRISLSFSFSQDEFSLDAVTGKVLAWALEKSGNNKSSAARLLKASRKQFY